jgi:hypothetical protein
MRVRTCVILASLVLAVSQGPVLIAQEADIAGWRQLRWGMSQTEVVEALRGEFDVSQLKHTGSFLFELENVSVDSVNYLAAFHFDARDHLLLVELTAGSSYSHVLRFSNYSSNYQALLQTLTQTYGPPLPAASPSSAPPPANQPGPPALARFLPEGGQSAAWHLKSTWIEVDLRGPRPDSNYLHQTYRSRVSTFPATPRIDTAPTEP